MVSALETLRKTVATLVVLSDPEMEAFLSIWSIREIKRKKIITLQGEREKNIYFVLSGAQRIYYSDGQGREATLIFTYPGNFGGMLDSMLTATPSRFSYETLSSSVLLCAPYVKLYELVEQYPGIRTLFNTGIAESLSGVLERLVQMQCFSMEERFRAMMERNPQILQVVPQKYLANYLGMDPTNFSKLINRIKI